MILSRDKGKRIWGEGGSGGSGGGGVSSSVLAGMLAGYATEAWVNENYISIDFFSRLFQAHGTENGQTTDIDPNDMDSTITSVESMFGFWTNLWITALGAGGPQAEGISLSMLTDVLFTTPITDGQVLKFNASTGEWTNGTAGASSLANLTDVTLTSLQGNQVLLYNAYSSKWVNSALKTINGQSLLGSGDISVGGGASGNYLPLSGGTMTGWITMNGVGLYTIIGDSWLRNWDLSRILQFGGLGIGYYPYFGANIWASNDGNTYLQTGRFDGYAQTAYSFVMQLYGGSVGIHTRTPMHDLHVDGISCSQLHYFSRGGTDIGYIGLTSSDNYNMGITNLQSGNIIFWGSGNVGVGIISPNYKFHVVGDTCSARHYFRTYDTIGYVGTTNDSGNLLTIYNLKAGPIMLYGSGVGIGIDSPVYSLHVSGTIYATGSITALSDARKKDITGEAGITVEQIAHAPAVQFLWKDKERRKDGQHVGTLAQYWQTVLPEVVSDKGGELSMQYGVAALVSAIVTARKVVDHERRICELEKENQRLKTEVEQLRLLN